MIQRYCSCAFLMLECTFSRTNGITLVNCLNTACQIATRMTMLKKGPGMQWRHLVYSDLPTIAHGSVSIHTHRSVAGHSRGLPYTPPTSLLLLAMSCDLPRTSSDIVSLQPLPHNWVGCHSAH